MSSEQSRNASDNSTAASSINMKMDTAIDMLNKSTVNFEDDDSFRGYNTILVILIIFLHIFIMYMSVYDCIFCSSSPSFSHSDESERGAHNNKHPKLGQVFFLWEFVITVFLRFLKGAEKRGLTEQKEKTCTCCKNTQKKNM